MKIKCHCLLLLLVASMIHANAGEANLQPIPESVATAIVQAQETAKELARDRREAELRNADIRASALAGGGVRRVVFNLVAPVEAVSDAEQSPVSGSLPEIETKTLIQAEQADEKNFVQFTLSGTVWDERISELWWDYEGVRYRIFVNANFLLFPGASAVEDETTRYSLFTILTGQQSDSRNVSDVDWCPTVADFSSEGLEYVIVDPADDTKIHPAAFAGIEAMLRHYAAHHKEMMISYDNAQKLRKARAAYHKANPPKERDTIINFRPRKNASGVLSTEQ